jgi:SAM-dependent methyltransferase
MTTPTRPPTPWHGFSTRALLTAAALTLLTTLPTTAQDQPARAPDVPYVPTPQDVVDQMLNMAELKPGDVHYDLGCGDGRIVVTAAKRGAKKAVGVDINPERIKESNANANAAGVNDKVRFVIDDLFTMDFKDADVVTLYLLPAVNLKLRPRLLDELKPGTRVVSHDFDMGDWKPDEEAEVNADDEGRQHRLYLWTIPAKLAGTWDLTLEGGNPATLTLTQNLQDVAGTLKHDNHDLPLHSATIKGNTLRFATAAPDGTAQATVYEAKLTNDTLQGTARTKDDTPKPWTAKRTTKQANATKP